MSLSTTLQGPCARPASRVPLPALLGAGWARLQDAPPDATKTSAQPARGDWAERLAAWAERQPAHRRLGHWTPV